MATGSKRASKPNKDEQTEQESHNKNITLTTLSANAPGNCKEPDITWLLLYDMAHRPAFNLYGNAVNVFFDHTCIVFGANESQ